MAIVERVKHLLLTPQTEWPVIAAEPASTSNLIAGYVAPLAALGAVAGLIGGSIIGHTLPFIGHYRVPITSGIVAALFTFAMAIVGVFILSFIINVLAPTFGGQSDSGQAMKVAVYSYTPAWVAGVFQILPVLGILALFGAIYGLYLLYLGLPRLMKAPPEKAMAYTAVVIVCAIVLSVVITAVGGLVVGAGMMGAGALNASRDTTASSDVQFDKDSAMGKLQELGKKMEESNKKVDAAGKSGDANAQVAAAMEGLGTMLGGGKRVEPIGIDQLKPFVPDTFAGLPKTRSSAERNGIAGLMVSKAEATFGDGAEKTVTLEVSDTGGISGLLGLASWAGVQGEKDDQNASERTEKSGGRLIHEKSSKIGGENEFAVVLGDRFIVSAKGQGVDLATLKAAVSKLDLSKLESMKGAGVQQPR